MFLQISLNFWKSEYEANWIVGESNELATKLLLSDFSQIVLSGPKFCGKKHLASIIAKKHDVAVYFLENMSDIEIIAKYDENVVQNKRAIWVSDGVEMNYAIDVQSRLKSLVVATIEQLSEDMIFPLLEQRLNGAGFKHSSLINYCIQRLPRTYEAVEELVRYIKQQNAFSLSNVQQFIAKKNLETSL